MKYWPLAYLLLNLKLVSLMSKNEIENSLQIAFEHITDEHASIIQADMKDVDESRFFKLVEAVKSILSFVDLPKTRIVLTADFVQSVGSRQKNSEQAYTLNRGSGLVAGKTMRPDKDGVVDIIFHLYLLAPQEKSNIAAERDLHIGHVGRHEAAHARLHHLGTEPFDVDRREEFGSAMRQFIAMASEQAEEHLAEYISIGDNMEQNWAKAESIENALIALEDVLEAKLPMIDDGIDYGKAMHTIFSAFHILWKALAFLAAELRKDDTFQELPDGIARLESWEHYVAPWWDGYLQLFGRIPMLLDVDIQATDEVVKDMAQLLQEWAAELGYDFHDTPDGNGWFQIENPVY